jgi:long-chain acyl-CoA synthetase
MIKVIPDLINKGEPKTLRKVALIYEGEKISYQGLKEKGDRLARAMINLGVKRGDKVGILLRNSPEFVISLFGIIKAGAIAVPLNFMLKEEELKLILEEVEAKIVISCQEYLPMLERLRLRIDCLETIILTDSKEEINFYDLLSKDYENITFPVLNENDIAVIIYTSGTTGKPKGVMLCHKNFISNIKSCLKAMSFSSNERVICLLPLFHSFSITVCLLLPFYISSTVILISSLTPFRNVVNQIIKTRVTIFIAIPPIYRVLCDIKIPWFLKLPVVRKLILPIKVCISGAAPLPVKVLDMFQKKFRVPLLEGYGLTETSPVISLNPLQKPKPGSVGLPLPGVKVKIVNEKGEPLPPGKEGELIVKGANVMAGYYKKEEATQEVIKEDWLYTGDIAKLDEEGYIYIIDRKKDIIIVRGLNVSPREIEEVIYQHPKIKEACVVGVPDESRGEVPKAFVVVKEGETLTPEELLEFLKPRLANYKIPRYIEFRSELPKSPSGKILRTKLREES